MKFSSLIAAFAVVGSLIGSPVFAASAPALKTQQQKFQSVLDTFVSANQKLETRITEAPSLDERTRSFLIALVRGEKSNLYSIRVALLSTATTKDIQALAKLAQDKRAEMKNSEARIITPLLQISDFETTALPTAESRLKTLDNTLTKSEYDRTAKKLSFIKHDAQTLHEQLLSTHPPADALKRVQTLHTNTINLYRDLRSKVK